MNLPDLSPSPSVRMYSFLLKLDLIEFTSSLMYFLIQPSFASCLSMNSSLVFFFSNFLFGHVDLIIYTVSDKADRSYLKNSKFGNKAQ